MNELWIIFEGIMVLGPPPPEDGAGSGTPGPLFAVMPRIARHESRYSKLNNLDPQYIPAHLPVVFTTLTPLGSRPEDEKVGDFRMWFPIRERMELRFSANAAPADLQYVVEGSPSPIPQLDPVRGIKFIADMRRIWPPSPADNGRDSLRDGMLKPGPGASEIIESQIFVPSGRVGSHGEFKKAEPAPVTFLPPRTDIPVTMDLLSQLVLSVNTDRVDFDMYSLDTGERLDSLAFATEDPLKPNIIRIANGDPKNIRYVIEHLLFPKTAGEHEPSQTKPIDSQKGIGDIDFEAGYDVLAGDDDGGELPIPWVPIPLGERNCNTRLANPPKAGS